MRTLLVLAHGRVAVLQLLLALQLLCLLLAHLLLAHLLQF